MRTKKGQKNDKDSIKGNISWPFSCLSKNEKIPYSPFFLCINEYIGLAIHFWKNALAFGLRGMGAPLQCAKLNITMNLL